ncbi:MAG: cysteine hydrolase family protein [Myxococcota bacterium]
MFSATAVLLVIDVQEGLDEPSWGPRNNPQAESNIARLLAAWRASGRPVIHIQHLSTEPDSPLRPEQPGHAIKAEARPVAGEQLFTKQVNSAFVGTDLDEYLRARGHSTLVMVGLTTNHCVSTTARMAGNLGFETFVVADATATFDRVDHQGQRFDAQTVHDVALASLHGEFATVLDTADVLDAIGTGG